MTDPHAAEALGDLAAEVLRLARNGATVLPEHPRGEHRQARVLRDEDPVLEPSTGAERPLDPPGRFGAHLDAGPAGRLAELPRRPATIDVDVEVRRELEVALAAGGETDVPSDPRDAEGADRVAVEIGADHVPDPPVVQEPVRVERPLGLLAARHRAVGELDRALLRDRRLELRQPPRHLRRVVRIPHLDPQRGGGRRLVRQCRPTEREVLEREPERLRIRELALEQVEAGLERGELVVGQLQLGQEVVLRAERVQLLARELVTLGVERDTEVAQLGAIGVEPPGEGLVRHLRVSLHVPLHVPGGQWAPVGHQERDQRELTDQLVGVVGHTASLYVWPKNALWKTRTRDFPRKGMSPGRGYAATFDCSRCWCEGQ
jgi:hypothetical protein